MLRQWYQESRLVGGRKVSGGRRHGRLGKLWYALTLLGRGKIELCV